MRRVSSRQRLVSWDAFDATDITGSSDEENNNIIESDEDDGSSQFDNHDGNLPVDPPPPQTDLSSLTGRKRSRKGGSTMVPCFSWELTNPTMTPSSSVVSIATLCPDAQVNVFGFLTEADLRRLASCNRSLRGLVWTSEHVPAIWKSRLQARWPGMDKLEVEQPLSYCLQDDLKLPTAAVSKDTCKITTAPNLPLLLSMTPAQLPTGVDLSLLDHQHHHESSHASLVLRRRTTRHLMFSRSSTSTELKLQADGQTIRYMGQIGKGDRCVRGNAPLARPQHRDSNHNKKKKNDSSTASFGRLSLLPSYHHHPLPAQGVHSAPTSFMSLLRQGARSIRGGEPQACRPFVSPFLSTSSTSSLNVTPSMVAYFEVDILHMPPVVVTPPHHPNDDEELLYPQRLTTGATVQYTRTPSECVAIGIATEAFRIHSRMPGWDHLSFGYHGDDGGTFHGSGGMNERFGPNFGAGDTVGCGIDYVARGIFFTLNGKFLGYGWKNLPTDLLQHDLYPVVGIDTNAPIQVNFGNTRPFAYNLEEFHALHARFIEPHYRFSVPSLSSSKSSFARHNHHKNSSSQQSLRSAASSVASNKSSSSSLSRGKKIPKFLLGKQQKSSSSSSLQVPKQNA